MPEQYLQAPKKDGAAVHCGVSPVVDDRLHTLLTAADAGRQGVWFVSSLSRLSRDIARLAFVLEFAQSRGVQILTTNALIRPGEVSTRRGPLQPAERDLVLSRVGTAGLSGVHAKLLWQVA